jgi:uncharacterized protein
MIREGNIQIPFRYAAGKAGSRFLCALRDSGKIMASRCGTCGIVYCPARSFCPRCGEALEESVEVGPYGTLTSWTEIPGRGFFGLVKLDDADMSILHRIIAPPATPQLGTRVVCRMALERTGSILDIEGFELLFDEKENEI